MFRLLLIAALVFVPSLRAQDSTPARVLAAEDRRFAAMVRGDTAALRTMLADDLAYTHTTGEKQDRAAFLRSIGNADLRYKSIAPSERTVRFVGADAVVVTGRSSMQVEARGQLRAFAIRYVAVYHVSAKPGS